MRRVIPPTIKFIYLDKSESEKRLRMAYGRIFEIAKRNVLERRRNGKTKNGDSGHKTGIKAVH